MDDLISRQEAIDAVHKKFDEVCVWDESGQTTANEVENILYEVSSAEPERTAKAEMLEELFSTSMTWEGTCSNCGSYTIHEMNYCFGCGMKLIWNNL